MNTNDCHCCTYRDIKGTDGHKLLEKRDEKNVDSEKLAVTNSEIFKKTAGNKGTIKNTMLLQQVLRRYF